MIKDKKENILLAWSKRVVLSDVQDPLGLNLRVSARLGSQLLYCITSITARARYYAFLPWCIANYYKQSSNQDGVIDGVALREKAFSLGCVIHHDGKACEDGRLVGVDSIARWYHGATEKKVSLDDVAYVQSPAFNAYFRSLVNLGVFVNYDEGRVTDESQDEEKLSLFTLELSELGQKLAVSYDSVIKTSSALVQLNFENKIPWEVLRSWGELAGLCELRNKETQDRILLKELFFNRLHLLQESHELRRQSLLILLFLANESSRKGCLLDEDNFNNASYFGTILDSSQKPNKLIWPVCLEEIVSRWRMFQFHYYLSYGLESLLVNIVDKAHVSGIQGFKLHTILDEIEAESTAQQITKFLGAKFSKNILSLTPKMLYALFSIELPVLNVETSGQFNEFMSINHAISEKILVDLLEDKGKIVTPEGVFFALLLIMNVVVRYVHLESSFSGKWLASCSNDGYKDITVPVLLKELRLKFHDFWNTSLHDILLFLMSRFVIKQHEMLAYDKSFNSSKSFIYSEGDIVRGGNSFFDAPTCHNPRFSNALLILKDLGLLVEKDTAPEILILTKDGEVLLAVELDRKISK